MYKKYPLLCTVATVMTLSSVHFNAYANSVLSAESGEDKTGIPHTTYEKIKVTGNGIIHGKDLKVEGPLTTWTTTVQDENGKDHTITHTRVRGVGVEASGPESKIDLENVDIKRVTIGLKITNNSTIKMTKGAINVGPNCDEEISGIKISDHSIAELNDITIDVTDGLSGATNKLAAQIENGSILTMKGGSIKSSKNAVSFVNSAEEKNKLEDVKINSKENGIITNASTITLKNVFVESIKKGLYANNGSQITVLAGSFEGKDLEIGISAENNSNIILKDGVAIHSTQNGIHADKSSITMNGGTVTTTGTQSAVYAKSNGQIDLTNVVVNAKGEGLLADGQETKITMAGETLTTTGPQSAAHAKSGGQIDLTNVVVNATGEGLLADGQETKITMAGETLTTTGPQSAAHAKSGGQIDLANVVVNAKGEGLLADGQETKITMAGETLTTTGPQSAAYAKSGGQIDLANVVVNATGEGLLADGQETKITMTGKTLTTTSPQSAAYAKSSGQIDFANVVVNAEGNGLKIQGDQSKIILKDSKVFADLLLISAVDTKSPGKSYLTADNSVLEGGARVLANNSDKIDQASFSLINGTKWLLKISTKEKDDDGNLLNIIQRARSEVSVLNLENSSITFNSPTEDYYQTLHIGSGKPDTTAVYNATGDAKIYFNTLWSDGQPIADQKTDRLLIHGDVLGKTTIYFQNRLEKEKIQANDSDPLNTRGISLIQVSGTANKDAFKLKNGYMAIKGLPYKYVLTAYGNKANYGKANANQNLLGSGDDFWDFRLQNAFLDPNLRVKAVLPQVPSYFIMPNALFYTGLTDMAKQNALLANMRTSVLAKEQEKQSGFFLYTYGSTGNFSSENAPRQYGYSGAHLRYAALQGGVNFAALEGQNTSTHFGLVGTYGQLSFTPQNMKDASKSTVDKWSITTYGTIQHDNGFYLDTLLSYGILKGDISNAIRGKTAKVKNAKMWSISTTIGKQFATGIQGLTFEPQAQLAYQHLMFDTISDADDFKVDMNNPHQWMIRVGGRFTKTVATAENGHSVSFYGKVNAVKTFGEDQAISIDKDYKLDPMGSFLEAGLGISAQLSSNVSLHGDVSYQQKLQKTGISGTSFSGGIRYQF